MWKRNFARLKALLRDDVLLRCENKPDGLGIFGRRGR